MNDKFEDILIRSLPYIKNKCRSNSRKFKINYYDLLGDTLEKIWRYRKTFKGTDVSSFEKWVNYVVYTVSVDTYRKKKDNVAIEEAYNIEAENLSYDDEQYLELIAGFLKKKLPTSWPVVLLIYRGYSDREIGEQLGISKNTARSRLRLIRRAVKRLTK